MVSQIKDGDNPVSLILAETFLGLNSVFHDGEPQNFLRSPLTLQIWLMERLDMIVRPTTGNYGLLMAILEAQQHEQKKVGE